MTIEKQKSVLDGVHISRMQGKDKAAHWFQDQRVSAASHHDQQSEYLARLHSLRQQLMEKENTNLEESLKRIRGGKKSRHPKTTANEESYESHSDKFLAYQKHQKRRQQDRRARLEKIQRGQTPPDLSPLTGVKVAGDLGQGLKVTENVGQVEDSPREVKSDSCLLSHRKLDENVMNTGSAQIPQSLGHKNGFLRPMKRRTTKSLNFISNSQLRHMNHQQSDSHQSHPMSHRQYDSYPGNTMSHHRRDSYHSNGMSHTNPPIRLVPMVQKERNQLKAAEKLQGHPDPLPLKRIGHFEQQANGIWKTCRRVEHHGGGHYMSYGEGNQMLQQGGGGSGGGGGEGTMQGFVPYSDTDTGDQGEIHHGYQYLVPACTPVDHWVLGRGLDTRSTARESLAGLRGTLSSSEEGAAHQGKTIVLKLVHGDPVSIPGASEQSETEKLREHCAFCDNQLFMSMYCPLKHVPIDVTEREEQPSSEGTTSDNQVAKELPTLTDSKKKLAPANPHVLLTTCSPAGQPGTPGGVSLRKIFRQNQLREKEVKNLLEDIAELNDYNTEIVQTYLNTGDGYRSC